MSPSDICNNHSLCVAVFVQSNLSLKPCQKIFCVNEETESAFKWLNRVVIISLVKDQRPMWTGLGIKEDLLTHSIEEESGIWVPPTPRADDAAGLQNNCHQRLKTLPALSALFVSVCLLHLPSMPTNVAHMAMKLPHIASTAEMWSWVPSLFLVTTETCVFFIPTWIKQNSLSSENELSPCGSVWWEWGWGKVFWMW